MGKLSHAAIFNCHIKTVTLVFHQMHVTFSHVNEQIKLVTEKLSHKICSCGCGSNKTIFVATFQTNQA